MDKNLTILKYTALSCAAIFFSEWFGFILYRQLFQLSLLDSSIGFQIVERVLSIALLLFLYLKYPASNPDPADRWQLRKSFVWLFVIFVVTKYLQNRAIYYGNSYYEMLFSQELHPTYTDKNTNELANLSFTWLFISSVIIAPLEEELLFRGILYSVWNRHFKPITCVFITALFFALCHYTNVNLGMQKTVLFALTTFPAIFITGLFLGATRVRFSIIHSILLHASVNGVVVLANLYLEYLK